MYIVLLHKKQNKKNRADFKFNGTVILRAIALNSSKQNREGANEVLFSNVRSMLTICSLPLP